MITIDDLYPSTTTGMAPATPQRKNATTSSQVWNDEFVFQQIDGAAQNLSASDASSRHEMKARSRLEHIDKEASTPRTPQRNVVEGLRVWSESPISTRHQSALGPSRVGRQEERENWDDDFLDSTDSPAKPCASTPAGLQSQSAQRARVYEELEEENWDEDFEMGAGTSSPGAGPSARSKRSRRERDRDAIWDSSDDEANNFDREMGFDCDDEEDKTVTSSRRKPLGSLANDVPPLPSPPPVITLPTFLPAIPSGDVLGPYASPPSPFPRSSPSHSVFSIPATTTSGGHRDRDSIYSSTAHLALSLRRTHSAESSPSSPMHQKFVKSNRFPQSPEAPRERRRLRKKSRPPHLDSSILELDDRAGVEPTFLRPSTPDSRPCTPPPSSSTGEVLSLTTPLSSIQASSIPPAPMSPTSASKSPLLARIGSMRRWGRKRFSNGTGTESGSQENANRNIECSPTSGGPSSAFLSGTTLDAEVDRFDNNRTPRPPSHIAPHVSPSSIMPPPPPLPPGTGTGVVGPPQTPSRNRFFHRVSGGMDTTASARSSLAVEIQDASRAKSRDRERGRLRVAIPTAVPITTQGSQSGDSEVGISTSPRRARIRAFGQKLLSSRRSASASSPERGKNSSDGESSQMSMHGYSHRQVSTPFSGETPTRLRPRIPDSHQVPSSLGKARPVFPRHVSGSALNENRSHFSPSPSMSATGRSVSATDSTGTAASSDELAHMDRGSDEKGGHRRFMGSMRRISLASAHARKRQQQSADSHLQCPVPAVPPLPFIPPDSDSLSSQLLPSSPKDSTKAPSVIPTSLSGAIQVDLTSPTSSPPRDWPSSGPPRRSGDLPALTHSKSSSFATSSSPGQNASVSRLSSSSQAASLGRASPLPIGMGASGNATAIGNANVHRRNSLGDLKIPSRISRAQDGLKRDLGRVREFAGRVEQMQELRASYFTIATQIQGILDAPRPLSRATSPTAGLFGLSRSNSRARSSTNPPLPPTIDYRSLALAFRAIDAKYSIAWECADLLIELGTGSVAEPSTQAALAALADGSDAARTGARVDSRGKNRERAVTLAGDEGKPDLSLADVASPPNPPSGSPPALVSWHASTGRHDFGHRQLYLLKEMLNNAESAKEGVQLNVPDLLSAPWGAADEAMDSSVTLPTDESMIMGPTPDSPMNKRRKVSRLGMVGIRDMLRSFKRSAVRAIQNQPEGMVAHSSTTISTDSSFDSHPRQIDNHPYSYNTVAGVPTQPPNARRKSETSAALIESMRSPVPDYSHFIGGLPLTHKSSPRRPSLASLFRLGQKHKATATLSSADSPEQSSEQSDAVVLDISGRTGPEERDSQVATSREDASDDIEDSDWDRMDSTSDVDAQIAAIADVSSSGRGSTMKLRKKKQQNRLSMPPSSRPITSKHHSHPFSSSQGSIATPDQSLTNIRSPRLSNVDENNVSMLSTGSGGPSGRQTPATPESARRPRSRAGKDRDRERQFSSVRTVPPKHSKGIPSFDASVAPVQPVSNLKLAMTPENIKPLLENARVVTARLLDCLAEVKGLLVRTEGSAFTLSASASSSNVALGPGSHSSNISSS